MKIKYRNHLQSEKRNRHIRWAAITLIAFICLSLFVYFDKQVRVAIFGDDSDGAVLASAQYQDLSKQQALLITSLKAKSTVGLVDMRAYVFDQYFLENKSPLYGTGKLFVDACDKYNMPKDCTTVVAIARAETDLCKYYNSATYFNCWGYGGGGGYRIYFQSWQQSIDKVSQSIAQSYGTEFILDPATQERRFCGTEPGCTGWGKRVKYHMQLISDYAKKLGFDKTLFELR